MIKKLLFIIAICATFTQQSFAQWALGDIAFTGYQADSAGNPSGEDDQFSFVLLRDVTTNEAVSFTENGWQAAGGFRATENTITLTFGASYSCGTQISIDKSNAAINSTGGSVGTITGTALSFVTSGDQIFAYDPANTPTSNANQGGFIAAIQMNGSWDVDASSSTTSAKPSIFDTLAGSSMFFTTEVDNAIYNCSTTSAIASVLRSAIHNQANWNVNNSTPFDQPAPCTFVSCSALSTNEFALEKTFSIFPNPLNKDHVLNIRNNSQNTITSVEVYDIVGKKILTKVLATESIQFPNTIPSGMYFVKITDAKNNSVTKKVMVQ